MNPERIKEINGDLLQMFADDEFDIIAHQCNCFHTFGSGIAKAIKNAFPEAYQADLDTEKGSESKMGTYSEAPYFGPNWNPMYILNIYSQYSYGKEPGRVYTDYQAMRTAFIAINKRFRGQKIGLPMIGCGSAGGDWNVVKKIIEETLVDMDVTIVHYKPQTNVKETNISEPDTDSGRDDLM